MDSKSGVNSRVDVFDSSLFPSQYVDPGEAEKRPTNFLVYYVIKEPEETAVSRSVSQKHTLTNLNPFTEYVVYVAAANSFGRGPLSATKTVSTRQDGEGKINIV